MLQSKRSTVSIFSFDRCEDYMVRYGNVRYLYYFGVICIQLRSYSMTGERREVSKLK